VRVSLHAHRVNTVVPQFVMHSAGNMNARQ
jgi:hypothetical protein